VGGVPVRPLGTDVKTSSTSYRLSRLGRVRKHSDPARWFNGTI